MNLGKKDNPELTKALDMLAELSKLTPAQYETVRQMQDGYCLVVRFAPGPVKAWLYKYRFGNDKLSVKIAKNLIKKGIVYTSDNNLVERSYYLTDKYKIVQHGKD